MYNELFAFYFIYINLHFKTQNWKILRFLDRLRYDYYTTLSCINGNKIANKWTMSLSKVVYNM